MADEVTTPVAEPAESAAEPTADSARVDEILSEMGATPDKGEESVELFGQDGAEGVVQPSSEPQEPAVEPKVTAPPKRTSALQKLIDEKYKGDEEAFALALINQQNAASDTRKELDELKEILASFKKEKEEPGTDPADSDPDVQYWNEQKTLLDEELQKLGERQNWLVDEYTKANEAVLMLKGKIEIADEFDKEKFQQELTTVEQYIRGLQSQWNDLPRFRKKLELDAKELNRRVETAKRDAHSKVQAQKSLEAQKAAERVAFRSELESLIGSVASQNGIDPESKQFRTLKKHIWNDIYATVSGMDPNAPGVNLQEAVAAAATEYFEAIGQQNRATFQAQSQQKLAATSPRTPTPIVKPSGAAKVVRVKELTGEQSRAHARAVLGD